MKEPNILRLIIIFLGYCASKKPVTPNVSDLDQMLNILTTALVPSPLSQLSNKLELTDMCFNMIGNVNKG